MKKILRHAAMTVFAIYLAAAQPAVISFTPPCNALNIAENTDIIIMFDSGIDPETLKNSTIKVSGSLSGLHFAVFSHSSETSTVTINPQDDFDAGELVSVALTRGIKSTTGDSLAKGMTWSFTVKTQEVSGTFRSGPTAGVGSNPIGCTAGDFNADGINDLAVANWLSDTVSILLNHGNGSFTRSSAVRVGNGPWSVIAGNFDGDADLDLAVVNQGSNTVSILLNNGGGIFVQSSAPGVGSFPHTATSGDFDTDGDLDLAVVISSSDTIQILLNNGDGMFTQGSASGVRNRPHSIAAADFDGDGDLDLATTDTDSTAVTIFTNSGSGVFTYASRAGVGGNPYSVHPGDYDGDGHPDLAVASGDYTVSIVLNNGGGVFTQASTVELASILRDVTAGDFNGDGDLDLALVNTFPADAVSILSNDGSGAFTQDTTVKVGLNPQSVSAADYDGDGDLDLAVTNEGFGSISILMNSNPLSITSVSPAPNGINISKNTAIGIAFDREVDTNTISASTIRIVGSQSGSRAFNRRYNKAARTDSLYPTVPFNEGELVTVTATRGVRATTGDSLIPAKAWSFTIKGKAVTEIFTESITVGVGEFPVSVAAAELNGDGKIDLAVANQSSGTVSVLINNGGGSFILSSSPVVGKQPTSVVAGDFNGDGEIDLAVANINSNTVSILSNNGSGSFTQSSTPHSGNTPNSVVAGDFDGDGDIDLIAINTYSDMVSTLTNNGSGAFTRSDSVNVASYPLSAVAGDLDGDGDIDLAVVKNISPSVSILLNNGDGSFTQSSTLAAGTSPNSVTAGDFDKDGDLDLAVPNYFDNTISIFSNNAIGAFVQTDTISVGSNPYGIFAGDFEGDGDIDLAVAIFDGPNVTPSTVSILLNEAGGIFLHRLAPQVGIHPGSIAGGNFDGDGYLDLAVTNYGSNTISILLNQKTSGTGVLERGRQPAFFSLSQNYPNPFNPATIIEYDVPKNSKIQIIVFDLLGRQVKKLVDEEQPAGSYKVEFNASGLSSGVYFYRLQTMEFSQTKKLILMR